MATQKQLDATANASAVLKQVVGVWFVGFCMSLVGKLTLNKILFVTVSKEPNSLHQERGKEGVSQGSKAPINLPVQPLS